MRSGKWNFLGYLIETNKGNMVYGQFPFPVNGTDLEKKLEIATKVTEACKEHNMSDHEIIEQVIKNWNNNGLVKYIRKEKIKKLWKLENSTK